MEIPSSSPGFGYAPRWRRVLLAIPVVGVMLAMIAAYAWVMYVDGVQAEEETLLRMQKVYSACKSYHTREGRWPESLDLLVEPSPDGKAALLLGGQDAIRARWGTPFSIDIRQDGIGYEKIYVVTTFPDGTARRWPDY